MKLVIRMNNGNVFSSSELDTNSFDKVIEKIGNKYNGFLNLGNIAVNIRNISSIEKIEEDIK